MISLRTKALLGFLALIIYVLIGLAMVQDQRERLLDAFENLEGLYATEESLTQVNSSVSHAVLEIDEAYFSLESELPIGRLLLSAEEIRAGLRALLADFPALRSSIDGIRSRIEELRNSPERSVLVDVRSEIYALVGRLKDVAEQVHHRKIALRDEYLTADEGSTQIVVWMGMGGIVIFGSIIAWRTTKLSYDLKHLRDRSTQIVNGERGARLDVNRSDEVGQLAQAIGTMQIHLRERELQLELTRQQQFHQDKMATIGVLSSAVAHEINNPIAAIQAIAETIQVRRSSSREMNSQLNNYMSMILQHTGRIEKITRQLSQFLEHSAQEIQLVDLNELIRSNCRFIKFDPRFSAVRFNFELDSRLPAIRAMSDQLTQLILNLLINAADAIDSAPERSGQVTMRSALRGGFIVIEIADTGVGMTPEQNRCAFDEYFTTKPAGKGTGIGLFLCRRIVHAHGGGISIESAQGVGTRVVINLPLEHIRAERSKFPAVTNDAA